MPADPHRSPIQLFGFSILCLMHLGACSYQRLHFPALSVGLRTRSFAEVSKVYRADLVNVSQHQIFEPTVLFQHEPLERGRPEPR